MIFFARFEGVGHWFELLLIRVMPWMLLVLGSVILFYLNFVGFPHTTPYASELKYIMISIMPVAFGLPLFAIRMRRIELVYDPYEEPFGEVVYLPQCLLKRR